jgi:hypothetical protein
LYQSWSHSFLVKVRHIIKTKRGKKLFAQWNIPLRKSITQRVNPGDEPLNPLLKLAARASGVQAHKTVPSSP